MSETCQKLAFTHPIVVLKTRLKNNWMKKLDRVNRPLQRGLPFVFALSGTLSKKRRSERGGSQQANLPLATITRCDLSATILFKLVDSYLIAFKFAQ